MASSVAYRINGFNTQSLKEKETCEDNFREPTHPQTTIGNATEGEMEEDTLVQTESQRPNEEMEKRDI